MTGATGAEHAFPGQNGLIVYVTEWDPNAPEARFADPEILAIAPDRSSIHVLTNDSEGQAEPVWSPDGQRVAFIRDGRLYVMRGNATEARRLAAAAAGPSWSPDGTRIAFSRPIGRSLLSDLFVIAVDGAGLRRLTRTQRSETQPAWSPDGRRIAFVAERQIYLMSSNGQGVRRLTEGFANDSPSWSPDGRRIAFVSGRTPGRLNPQIWVMNANGTQETQLTEGAKQESWGLAVWSDTGPTWSPDGRWIAYVSGEATPDVTATSGIEQIFRMRPDGSDRANVSRSLVNARDPDWQPICSRLGTRNADRLLGTPASDLLCGLEGADVLRAGSGDDVVIGGSGRDVLHGGPGSDRLFGSGGDDSVYARDGQADVVDCGPGRDRAVVDRADVSSDCE